MGYMLLICECGACHKPLTCNPDLVPSIRINGVREPLCRECVAQWERIHGRSANAHPDAYDPLEN